MKKVLLYKDEVVVHKIRFSKRSFLLNLLFLTLIVSITARIERVGFVGYALATIFAIVFFILFILTLLNFYRIFFHRVYITNFRIIYVKGYFFKHIRYINKDQLTGVFFKSRMLDRVKNMTTFKCTILDEKPLIIKDIKEGKKVADILSIEINKQNQKYEKKLKRETSKAN